MRVAMGELLIAGLRLAHALAAASWLGGVLVLGLFPGAKERVPPPALREGVAAGVAVFLISGVILSVQRLGSAPLPPTYFLLLGIKALLGLWMFGLARRVATSGQGGLRSWRSPETRLLSVGVLVYTLATALRVIYENTVRG